MKTILIAGLGNPGKEYAKTRHNAGFMFMDYFWEKYREEFGFSDWKLDKKLKSEISIGKIGKIKDKKYQLNFLPIGEKLSKLSSGDRIIFLKPQTFMNLSGEAVAAAVKYYKVKLENIIVTHDEIDLALGKYKISKNSTSAGHNGAQNVIDALGTKNFTRLRIGADNRGDKKTASSADKIPTEKYVLGKFTAAELKMISNILPEISEELIKYIILSS